MELEEAIMKLCSQQGGCTENFMVILGRLADYHEKTVRATIRNMIREGKIYCCRTERVYVKT